MSLTDAFDPLARDRMARQIVERSGPYTSPVLRGVFKALEHHCEMFSGYAIHAQGDERVRVGLALQVPVVLIRGRSRVLQWWCGSRDDLSVGEERYMVVRRLSGGEGGGDGGGEDGAGVC